MDGSDGTGGAGCFIQANGSGGWGWAAWPTALNYDGGSITSDGSGNITATGFYGSLLDTYYSSGSIGYYSHANGDGTWSWAEWPSTLNYDSGSVVSDGSGDVTAVSVQAQLWDSTTSSGSGGQVATAQGDGTWLWQSPASAMVAGPASAQNIFTNATGAHFGLMVNATTNGFIFVPLP